jgi:hypothetical protein
VEGALEPALQQIIRECPAFGLEQFLEIACGDAMGGREPLQ